MEHGNKVIVELLLKHVENVYRSHVETNMASSLQVITFRAPGEVSDETWPAVMLESCTII